MSAPSVGIVGGGLLGLTAAYRLARRGVRVTVYERGGRPRRPRRHLRPRRPPGRPLLPRRPADRRPRHRPRRRARPRRRSSACARSASASTTTAGSPRCRPPRELLTFPGLRTRDRAAARRPSSPAASAAGAGGPRHGAAGAVARRSAAGGAPPSGSGGRCSTPSSTAATTTCPRPTCGRARAACPARATSAAARSWAGSRAATSARRRACGPASARRRRGPRRHPRGAHPGDARDGAIGVVVDGVHRAVRHGRLHAAAPAGARPARPRAARARPGGPQPLPRRRLPGAARATAVSPYYALNITDRRIPLTTVVETTHVVDPEHVGGTLLYVPRYVNPDNPDLDARRRRDRATSTSRTRRTMLPALGRRRVLARRSRAPASPSRSTSWAARRHRREMFPAPGLALASSAHVYPEVVNGQAVIGVADRLAAGLLAPRPHVRRRWRHEHRPRQRSSARRSRGARGARRTGTVADRPRHLRRGPARPSPGTRGATSAATPATTWSPSQRLADGELPYLDFPYFYGPLGARARALVVLIGGSGLAPSSRSAWSSRRRSSGPPTHWRASSPAR